MKDFGDRTWTEVDRRSYRCHNDVYCLMDHETLIHYIAGFMRIDLQDNFSRCDDFLIFLCLVMNFVTSVNC